MGIRGSYLRMQILENHNNIRLTAAPVHCHAPCMDIPLRSGSSVGFNQWEVYEELKKSLPDNLSPKEYEEAILEICDALDL